MLEDPLESALTKDGTNPPQFDEVKGGKKTEQLVDCIGKRCYLEQFQKKFRSISISIDGRAGPKKCPSCRQFKPALSKAL